jgi:hypothetical protein
MAAADIAPFMSAYDSAAWKAIHVRIDKRQSPNRFIPAAIAAKAAEASKSIAHVANSIPKAEDLKEAVAKALQGFEGIVTRGARATLSDAAVLKAFRKSGHELSALKEIHGLDLRDADKAISNLALKYAMASGAEGAAAGFAVSGGEALAAGGTVLGAGAGGAPGVGLVLTALAGDAAATLFACRRAVGHVAMSYGYDVRSPEEDIIAAKTLSFGLAGGTAKATAFRELNALAQGLARRKAWAELNQSLITTAIREIYTRLGFRLTQRKLGQAVPVLGIAIGAGMNARTLQSVVHDAQDFYRRRFLCDKYGLPFTHGDVSDDADVSDLTEILEAEIVAEEGKVSPALEANQ